MLSNILPKAPTRCCCWFKEVICADDLTVLELVQVEWGPVAIDVRFKMASLFQFADVGIWCEKSWVWLLIKVGKYETKARLKPRKKALSTTVALRWINFLLLCFLDLL